MTGWADEHYRDGTCRWWHLSGPSPELLAAEAAGELGEPGVAVDLGCGLGSEIGYLAGRGWRGIGVDLAGAALERARAAHPAVTFTRADVARLPVGDAAADLILDRGCFHYLGAEERAGYAGEAARVLRPGGRLLLRMCLSSAGAPNGLGEDTVTAAFGGWWRLRMERRELVSDSRTMPAVLALLERPGPPAA